eukprot:RCo035852
MIASRALGRILGRVPRNSVLALYNAYMDLAREAEEEARAKGKAKARAVQQSITKQEAFQVLGLPAESEKQPITELIKLVQERYRIMYEINAPDEKGEGGSPYIQRVVANARDALLAGQADLTSEERQASPADEKEAKAEPKSENKT